MTLVNGSRLSRFLTRSNHFKGQKATYRAFLPPGDLRLSTYHTDDLSRNAVRDLAGLHLLPAMIEGTSIYGSADLTVAQYATQNLVATRDDDPERHTSISGWPVGSPEDKEAHKEIALELAELASLSLFETPLKR
jgi:hypothetical protein